MRREKLMKRLEQISKVGFDKVIWNKDHTGFIGITYFENMYYEVKDYFYIKDGGFIDYQVAVNQGREGRL